MGEGRIMQEQLSRATQEAKAEDEGGSEQSKRQLFNPPLPNPLPEGEGNMKR
jgi:hypothetical protein